MAWRIRQLLKAGRQHWFATLGATLVLMLVATAASAQVGFDRPGGDYSQFPVRGGDPAVCSQRCDRDGRCKSWSFSYPATVSPRAMCWLKAEVPTRVESGCCVSGVKGSGLIEPRGGTEFGVDRFGGDLRTLEMGPDPTGDACAKACTAENRCRAWTYVRPGYFSAGGRCYLKSRVTRPRKKPCCISGVVR